MAVQSLNPLEKHAGKLFLGVVLIVVGMLSASYIVGEPVEISPLRDRLGGNAQTLERQIAPGAEFTPKDIPQPPKIVFEPGQAPVANLAMNAVVGPAAQKSGPIVHAQATDLNTLTPLLTGPSKPQLQTWRGVASVLDAEGKAAVGPDGKPRERALNCVIASAEIPLDRIAELAARIKVQDEQPLVLAVVLERQECDSGGQPRNGCPVQAVDPAPNVVRVSWPSLPENAGIEKLAAWVKDMEEFKKQLSTKQAELLRPAVYVHNGHPVLPVLAVEKEKERAAGGPNGESAGVARQPGGDAPTEPARPVFAFRSDETVREGATYIYRLRYEFLNPGLNRGVLKQDRQVVVAGPAGPWSDPVHIEVGLRVFVVAGDDPRLPVSANVHRYFAGQWHRKNVELADGKPVRAIVSTPGEALDVDTGLVPVTVDREAKVFTKLVPSRTVEVLFVDAAGRLFARQLADDKMKDAQFRESQK